MSGLGHPRRVWDVRATAALPLEAEIAAARQQRREGPVPDILLFRHITLYSNSDSASHSICE
jgi:hypothetical protein